MSNRILLAKVTSLTAFKHALKYTNAITQSCEQWGYVILRLPETGCALTSGASVKKDLFPS